MLTLLLSGALWWALSLGAVAHAEIYRCGEEANVTYSDRPCGPDAQARVLPPLSNRQVSSSPLSQETTPDEDGESESTWDPRKHRGQKWEAHKEDLRNRAVSRCYAGNYNRWISSQRPRPSKEMAESAMETFRRECVELYPSTKTPSPAKSPGKYDVIDNAVRKGDLAAVSAYLDGGGDPDLVLSFPDPIRKVISAPLLVLAANYRQEAICRILVSHGAKADASTQDGYTALHAAARHGQTDLMELLISRGVSIAARTSQGYTPLHSATHGMSLGSVQFLLGKKAPINAMDYHDGTPLQTAVIHNRNDTRLKIIQILLESGADPNLSGPSGDSPLHAAIRNQSPQQSLQVIRALLMHGAKTTARNRKGETPGELARQLRLPEVATLLDSVSPR